MKAIWCSLTSLLSLTFKIYSTLQLNVLTSPPSFHGLILLSLFTPILEYEQCEALTCLFHLSLVVYDSIVKESDLSDMERKHLTKRAKYSQNDIG